MMRLQQIFKKKRNGPSPTGFKVSDLLDHNKGLLDGYVWRENPPPQKFSEATAVWLHLGCGERILNGFVNIDFIPDRSTIVCWDLLDKWPLQMAGTVAGIFSEDLMEHFFYPEQLYILCYVNIFLKYDATYRVMMPNLASLVNIFSSFSPSKNDFLLKTFGALTGADALNTGMRFSGHRWLHSPESFTVMAEHCGFAAKSTNCDTSSEPRFNHLNLRNETNSLSFATDLKKSRALISTKCIPEKIIGAELVEKIDNDQILYRSISKRPHIQYRLTTPVNLQEVVLMNIRSANFSNRREHSLKSFEVITETMKTVWHFDETMKSASFMNPVTFSQLSTIIDGPHKIERIDFIPAGEKGEYFSVGELEIFHF